MTPSARAVRLTLLAHGTTLCNRTASFPAGDDLDDRAFARMPSLARRLGNPDCVFTSPAAAAQQTASALALPATVDPMLRDWDHGRWAGMSVAEIARMEPGAFASWRQDPDATPHGGESLNGLLARVGAWLGNRSQVPGHLLAITHAGVLRAAVVHVLGSAAPAFWHIDVAPLTLVTLSFATGRWTLRSIEPA